LLNRNSIKTVEDIMGNLFYKYFQLRVGVLVGNEKLIEVLDKLIERSERWSKDAEKRKDLNSSYFMRGKQKLLKK
jgi:hypothetical protein